MNASAPTNPNRSERVVRILSWIFGWVIPLSALALLIVFGFLGRSNTLVTWVGFLGCYLVSVILHELGHYSVARVVGHDPVLVSIGHGDLLLEKFAFHCTWRIHALAFSGYVLPYRRSSEHFRSKALAVTAAAPLVNALIAVFCLWLMRDPQFKHLHAIGQVDFEALVLNFFLANSFLFLASLVTFYPSPEIEKDGARILKYLFNRDPSFGSSETKPSDPPTPIEASSWRYSVPMLLAMHRHFIHSSRMSEEDRLTSLQNFSVIAALHSPRHLREADEYSRQLSEAGRKDWRSIGARGCVLVQLDRLDEGIQLLEPAFNAADSPFHRAIYGAFLPVRLPREATLKAQSNGSTWPKRPIQGI